MLLIWLSRTHPERMLPEIEAAVRSGLREARWLGRLEVIRSSPLAVIDVGHTPDAVRQALASLKAIHGADRWILVLGVSFDKKAGEIVEALAPAFDTIICTAARHKGMDAEKLARAVREANPAASVQLAPTIEEAVELSQVLAAAQGRRIYAAGGLFLAVEYANISGGGHARDLAFL
jgi:dihydrofolate synthase/folylpolyglutamate synthase